MWAVSTKFFQWCSSVPCKYFWVAQWYPSVHWVNQWHSNVHCVHWLRVRGLIRECYRQSMCTSHSRAVRRLVVCKERCTPRCSPLHGLLSRYLKLRVAHAPGMLGTFSHHRRLAIPTCMPGSLSSSFLLSWRRGKCSRRSRRMHNPKFYVSGKRPMPLYQLYFNDLLCELKRSEYDVLLYDIDV